MVYHSRHLRTERANLKTNEALVALVNDICSLAGTQTSALCILRYMVLAYSYDIKYVIVQVLVLSNGGGAERDEEQNEEYSVALVMWYRFYLIE